MRPLCIIVGAMEPGRVPPPGPEDLLIAADRGWEHLRRQGLTPHLTVGDFDSLGWTPEGENVICHPVEKDDTDTMLAVKTALARGYREFLLLGCSGGRPDHAYANLQALVYLTEQNAAGWMLGQGMAATALRNGRLDFAPGRSGVISVFCPNGEARGVDLTGLHYPLRDAVLTSAFPLGVSNQFTGAAASVSVREGTLLVMWEQPEGCLPEQLHTR